MRFEPQLKPPSAERPLWHRLCWMALIWAGSVASLGLFAYAIRWWLKG